LFWFAGTRSHLYDDICGQLGVSSFEIKTIGSSLLNYIEDTNKLNSMFSTLFPGPGALDEVKCRQETATTTLATKHTS
jgi:hypothetical protein